MSEQEEGNDLLELPDIIADDDDCGRREECSQCSRPTVACWCPYLPNPRIDVRTHVIILQHPLEERRALRTAPMVQLGLAPGKCTIYRGKKFPTKRHQGLQEILDSPRTVILFPGPHATDVTQLAGYGDAGDTYNSGVCGDTCNSAVGGDTCNSAVGGDTCNSAASGDTYNSPIGGDTYSSAIGSDTYKCTTGDGDSSDFFIIDPINGVTNDGHKLNASADSNDSVDTSSLPTHSALMEGSSSICATSTDIQNPSQENAHEDSCEENLETRVDMSDNVSSSFDKQLSSVCTDSPSSHRSSGEKHLNGDPYNVLILDGTWRQAKTMYTLSPALHRIKQVQVVGTQCSSYVVRTQPTACCLSTVEAAAACLQALERRPALARSLLQPLHQLCRVQLAHGAVKHTSKQELIEKGEYERERGVRTNRMFRQLGVVL